MAFIYLAQPYSDKRPHVIHWRYMVCEFMVAHYTKGGETIYSPIQHFHSVAHHYDLPKTFEFWEKLDFDMLDCAKELRILELPGWGKSRGLSSETKFAMERNKRITRVSYDTIQSLLTTR